MIQLTADGSHTIVVPELNIAYHSRYGAIQESMHVFIQTGMHYFLHSAKLKQDEVLTIFEMGLGTGLNALLSLSEAIHLNQKIFYKAIEPFPLSLEEAQNLNYTSLVSPGLQQNFLHMHRCGWNKKVSVHPLFLFVKSKIALEDLTAANKFHLIYFDAFDPRVQPALWNEDMFCKMFNMLENSGVLVTYCSKGAVRRALQNVGFTVEKIAGPPGKKEILRAVRNERLVIDGDRTITHH